MQLHMHLPNSVFGKVALAAAALSAFLVFSGASSAQARDRDEDRRPIVRYDNFREHQAFQGRGYYSPPAEYRRHERREALEHGRRDRYGFWHRY